MAEAKLVVELIGKVYKFTADMERAKKSVEGLQKSVSIIKIDSIVNLGMRAMSASKEIYNFAKAVASSANDIERQSKVIGMSISSFQQWQYAAKMADVSNESLAIGMKMLSRSMEEASQGAGDQSKWFNAMGISVKDTAGNLKPLDKMMREIADKFASWEDGPRKIAIALALFGRSGQDMVPIMNLGASGIEKFMQKAKELGVVLSDDIIKAGTEADEIFKRITARIDSFKISLAPAALEFAKFFEAIMPSAETVKVIFEEINRTIRDMKNLFEGLGIIEKSQEISKKVITIGGPKLIPAPTIGNINIEKIKDEMRKLEAQRLYGSHYGANIGMSEGEGLVSGMMEITTDEIERYDKIYDAMDKVIGLQAVYRKELVSIADAVEQLSAIEKAQADIIESNAKAWGEYADAEFDALEKMNEYINRLSDQKIEDSLKAQEEHLESIYDTLSKIEDITREAWSYVGVTETEEAVKKWQETQDKMQAIGNAMSGIWMNHINAMIKGTETFGEAVKKIFADMADYVIQQILKMAMNYALFQNVTGTYASGKGLLGFVGKAIGLAEGAYVNKPTLAMVGEAGPEYVIPEKKMGGGSTYNVFNIQAVDAPSFVELCRRNPSGILSAVSMDARASGGMRNTIRSYG